MTIQEFAHWFASIPGVYNVKYNTNKILFLVEEEESVLKITETTEISNNSLTIHPNNKTIMFCLHLKDYKSFYNNYNKDTVVVNKNGLADLSLVTCNQIANELKKRKNLTFALLWIEENSLDNISFEGNGDPTKLCGLLARGLNLAINWADKNMDFQK